VRPTRVRRFLLLVVALVAALLVLPARGAWACSCAAPATADAARSADVVLVATVVAASGRGPWSRDDAGRYELAVTRVLKGAAPERTEVREDPRSCGLGMRLGREHVVFADTRDGRLVSSTCAGTALAASGLVADVERVTGPGQAPAPGGDTRGGDTAWLWPVFGGAALALLLGAALVMVVVRGGRRPGSG